MLKTKVCTKCKKKKLISKFYKNKSKKDGLAFQCKLCTSKYHKKYRKENPEQTRQYSWACEIKRDYGITTEQYWKMFENQKGFCAICGQPERAMLNNRIKKLAIDHNHVTKKVRGLLCQRCNVKLSHIEDLDFVIKAKIYLKETEE